MKNEEYRFEAEEFFPRAVFEAITEVRVNDPDAILREAQRLCKRPTLTLDGRLVIVATDHPGRRVTALREDPLRMGNRHEYLSRALRVLTAPGCDGIMGTPDFMEEILIVSHLIRQSRQETFLDNKVLVGCMNRGGFAGVLGEIDDRFTAFSAEELSRLRFDGGKMMYRLTPSDERTIKSISDCAQAVTDLHRKGLYSFLEPLHMLQQADGGYKQVTDSETLIKDVGATAALGESASKTWLKLPYSDDYHRVAEATTLPILMLGGPAQDTPEPTLRNFASGMKTASNVRGVMVGRNVTFVAREDPRAVAAAVGTIVHDGASAQEAMDLMHSERSREMDLLQT
ncbi:MAG TPA: hypothetical protein VMY18_03000 [Acidobacteriota bacterium]|nr:hypothetical protein [Acidobacteriota bacterium]